MRLIKDKNPENIALYSKKRCQAKISLFDSVLTAWKRKNFRIKRIYVIPLIVSFFIAFSLFLNVVLYKKNYLLKSSLPYLIPGEKINYFNLHGKDNEKIDISALNGKIAFIFVFKKGCISCSGNLVFWNKLSALVKGKKIINCVKKNYKQGGKNSK